VFERLHEGQEIRIWRQAFDEKMKVVGHEAVGVNGEITSRSSFAEDIDQQIAKIGVTEIGPTLRAAERYEDGDVPAIVVVQKTDGFPGRHEEGMVRAEER